jgi:hypothetical protein
MSRHQYRKLLLAFAIVSGLFFSISYARITIFGAPNVSDFGPIQTGEHIALVFTLLLWIRAAFEQRGYAAHQRQFHPLIARAIVLLTLLAAGREMGWMGVYRFEHAALIGTLAAFIVAMGLSVIAFLWVFRVNGWVRESFKFIGSPTFVFVALASFLVGVATVINDILPFISNPQLAEETIEFWGYTALLFAGLVANLPARSDGSDTSPA